MTTHRWVKNAKGEYVVETFPYNARQQRWSKYHEERRKEEEQQDLAAMKKWGKPYKELASEQQSYIDFALVVGKALGVSMSTKGPGAKPVSELDEIFSAKHPQVDAFVYERSDSIRLQSISVPKEFQREGLGTAYIQDLVDYADEVGKPITLSTGGRGFDFPKGKLIAYYKRFGFVENKGRNLDLRISDTMYRKPVAKP